MDETDFTFAWEGASSAHGPWFHLRVIAFEGTEAIGSLCRYVITGAVMDGDREIDPEELIGVRATLRIATYTEPRFRFVHGIVIEAEEIGPIDRGAAYRVAIAPPLVRAAHRTRCRIFLDKTTRQIIDAVLQGDPNLTLASGAAADLHNEVLVQRYEPAREVYAWRVSASPRLDDATVRPYCVQYNESDWAFVSRLLEEEGIGYHVENDDAQTILVLADRDVGRTRLDPFAPSGPHVKNRVVSTMKLGARLRPRKVSLFEYNWKNPALDMAVDAPARPTAAELASREYPGLYPDAPSQGLPLAVAKLDRLQTEARYSVGEGHFRVLTAGSVFAVEHPRERYDGEYLVTQMEVRGAQHGAINSSFTLVPETEPPYRVRFECARRGKGDVEESRFRPARATPKPRILGTQTAFVTAEPKVSGEEIHIGGPPGAEIGCVRVRFHWDQEVERLAREPSSCWVRVSQVFAGAGQGAVWHPRVGVEVVVDFEDGDPDRPLIVGRVYNGKNVPPTVAPRVSTLKSMTSPGDGTFNEFTFDDTAGAQQIRLHTPRDWNSEVGRDRTEEVGEASTSSVGTTRTESTGTDRTTLVGNNNVETVGANETITVGANQALGVGGDQDVVVSGDQAIVVVGSRSVRVEVDEAVKVVGEQLIAIDKTRSITVGIDANERVEQSRRTAIAVDDTLDVRGEQTISIGKTQRSVFEADQAIQVGADQVIAVGGSQTLGVKGKQIFASESDQILVAPAQELIADATQTLSSDTLTMVAKTKVVAGSPEITIAGETTRIAGKTLTITFDGDITLQGKAITLQASTLTLNGHKVSMGGGTEVEVQAALIKLN